MSRKNAFAKNKLKRSVFVLIVIFIFIVSITSSNIAVQKKVATSEELKACSSTLESVYKKLDSEEIRFLSDDNSQALSASVPNKFGKVTVSGNPDGDLIILYDYEEPIMYGELFARTFSGTLAGIVSFYVIYKIGHKAIAFIKEKRIKKT